MKGLIKTILKYIMSLIQRFVHKAKVKKLESEIVKIKEIKNESVNKANEASDDFDELMRLFRSIDADKDKFPDDNKK